MSQLHAAADDSPQEVRIQSPILRSNAPMLRRHSNPGSPPGPREALARRMSHFPATRQSDVYFKERFAPICNPAAASVFVGERSPKVPGASAFARTDDAVDHVGMAEAMADRESARRSLGYNR
tara:strand:- start:2597 stop:2965 length:369 start_codon:yes stop_codon:yes gene_type:complete